MTSDKKIIRTIRSLKTYRLILLFCLIHEFLLLSNMLSAAAKERLVTVGLYENKPKIFTSESGKPSGIFIDIIEHIAKSEDWTLHYVPGSWGECLDRLKKGDIDLMPDVAYTADRGKFYSFNMVPVLTSWFQVYAPKGSKIQSILDLNGKKVVVLDRSIQQEEFIRLGKSFNLKIRLVSVPDYENMFEIVAANKADAAVTNRFFGLMNARKFGLEDTAIIFHPSDLFFSAPKKASGDLLNTIDKHLSIMKKDPESVYYLSLKRWISEEVKFKFPEWLKLVGLLMGIILFTSLAGTFILKYKVNARTDELNTALQRFIDIVEFLPDATFVIDRDKKVIAWNKACENLTGIKKEKLLSRGNYAYAEPFFGEQRPILIDHLDMPVPEIESEYKSVYRIDNKIYAESFIQRLRGGYGAHLWGIASPLYDKDGQRCGAIESIRDVTDQRRTEEALRASERKYRELVMLANIIILHWTHEGKIIFMNEFGLRFFGYTENELIGKHVVGTIVPETESTGRDLTLLMKEICEDTKKFERNVNENMRSNGDRIWIDWANKVVFDERGNVKEILSIGSDITERQKAEEEIHRLNIELQEHADILEQRVGERTAELADAMEKAQSADKIKSAFLATMSHELRTPLNSIIGFTGIMLQGLAGPLNDEQNKQLNMIQNSSRHLLALINDVLDISKIEAGQLELSSKPFELRPSLEKTVKLILPLAEKKGLTVSVDIPENTGTITADQRRLEQIILNLLNNAVKFTEKGDIFISCRADESQYHISIADTGIGIQAEEIPNLFQPFHQIDTGTARKTEGTGLGLSICRKILDIMGGSIHVQSKLGKGSTFSIRFPIMPEDHHEQ